MSTYKRYCIDIFQGSICGFPNVVSFNGDSASSLYQEILHNYTELRFAVKVFNANGYFPIEFSLNNDRCHFFYLSFQFFLHDGTPITCRASIDDRITYQDFLCVLRSFIRHLPVCCLRILSSCESIEDVCETSGVIYYRPLDLLEKLKVSLSKGTEQIREKERTLIRYNISSLSHLIDAQTIRTMGRTFSEMQGFNCSTECIMTDIVTKTTVSFTIPNNVTNIRFEISSNQYDNLIHSLEKILKHAKSEAKKNNRDKEPLRDYVTSKLWRYPGVHRVFKDVCRAIHADYADKPSKVIGEIIKLIDKEWLISPSNKSPFLYGKTFFKYLKEYTHSNLDVDIYSRMARKMIMGT